MQRVPKDVWNLIFHEIDNEDVTSWNQVCQCFRQIGQKWESETITKLKAKFTDKEQIRSRNSHECYLCAENCKHVPTVTILFVSVCYWCCLNIEDVIQSVSYARLSKNALNILTGMGGLSYSS